MTGYEKQFYKSSIVLDVRFTTVNRKILPYKDELCPQGEYHLAHRTDKKKITNATSYTLCCQRLALENCNPAPTDMLVNVLIREMK